MGILRKLRIRKTQKLGLILVFSVCLLTIALELFRFIRNITGDQTTNNILYAVINANLTIIISCTPTYRSLWTLWRKSRSKRLSDQNSSDGYARPRQSTQKLPVGDTEHLWSDSTYLVSLPIALQDVHQTSSFSTLQPPQSARPPSYRSVL